MNKVSPKLIALLFTCIFSSVLADNELDPFIHLSGHVLDSNKEALTFSNTQNWGKTYLNHATKAPKYLPENWRTKIAAASPPANSSKRTRAELDYLLKLQETRTEEDIQRITKEIKLVGFSFDNLTYSQITDVKTRPRTAILARAANADITNVMFQAKKYFDRVRPHKLDARIKPGIDVPAHAAYPSGHSTQAFMWSYLLCELLPEERHKSIIAGAQFIAQDRELAGVHYPSDTALGQRIARQVVDMWMANQKFRAMVEAARPEWK